MDTPIAASEWVRTNLPALRTLAGLSQRQFAQRLTEFGHPVTHSTVAKIERGEQAPKVDDVIAFAAVLDVSPLRLMLPSSRGDERRLALSNSTSIAGSDAWMWAEQDTPWWYSDDEAWQQRDASAYRQWSMRRLSPERPSDQVPDAERIIDATGGGGTAALLRELEALRSGDYGRVLRELRELRKELHQTLLTQTVTREYRKEREALRQARSDSDSDNDNGRD